MHKPEAIGPEASLENNPVVGNWKMEKVFDEGKDVTQEHNPQDNRWIQFHANQVFMSDGAPYGPNTGKWYWKAKSNLLFLDSDAGEDDDSYWTVSFEKDKMVWLGTESDFAKRFKLVHSKGEWIDDKPQPDLERFLKKGK